MRTFIIRSSHFHKTVINNNNNNNNGAIILKIL